MSQPRDPYRGVPRQQPYQQPYQQQPYQQQPPYQSYQQPQYQPRYEAAVRERPSGRTASPPRRIPGLGLLLTLAGLVVQALSLTVLPWVVNGQLSAAVPSLWHAATTSGTHGFGEWYLVLFSYPLAALSILLALASVLDSVALKVVWGGLTLVGLGFLVLRYGFGPFTGLVSGDHRLDFSRQEITTAVIALAALVAVIFVLKTAIGMFRRVAGLILLAVAGVHIAAVLDLIKNSPSHLGIGAYLPAAGYALVAIAAFIGPKRLPGI